MPVGPINAGLLKPWVSLLFLEEPLSAAGSGMATVRRQVELLVDQRADMELVADGMTGLAPNSDVETDGLLFRREAAPSWSTAGQHEGGRIHGRPDIGDFTDIGGRLGAGSGTLWTSFEAF